MTVRQTIPRLKKKMVLYNPFLILLILSSDSKIQMERKAFLLFGLYQGLQIDAKGKLIVSYILKHARV